MRKVAIVAGIGAVSAFKVDAPAQTQAKIDKINNAGLTWTAGFNERFSGYTLGQAAKLCGTIVSGPMFVKQKARKLLYKKEVEVRSDLPTNFDSRTAWPACTAVVGHVRDQSDCGSCWAFGTTEALEDRLCIATNGTWTKLLSPQDTASCCDSNQGCASAGCDGGYPDEVWSTYFTKYGVVTGGDYSDVGTGKSCFPYQLPDCAHHEPSPHYPNCSSTEYPTPACPIDSGKGCTESTYPTAWKADKHKATSGYNVDGVQQIMTEIMNHGPVTATLTVYDDLLTYRSGVYQVSPNAQPLGGHAIEIVGWGVDGSTPYWTIKNSWNADWGNQGFFNILRGQDECGIEDDISAGLISA